MHIVCQFEAVCNNLECLVFFWMGTKEVRSRGQIGGKCAIFGHQEGRLSGRVEQGERTGRATVIAVVISRRYRRARPDIG